MRTLVSADACLLLMSMRFSRRPDMLSHGHLQVTTPWLCVGDYGGDEGGGGLEELDEEDESMAMPQQGTPLKCCCCVQCLLHQKSGRRQTAKGRRSAVQPGLACSDLHAVHSTLFTYSAQPQHAAAFTEHQQIHDGHHSFSSTSDVRTS